SFSILLALLRFLFRKKRISKNKRRTNKKNLEDMNSEDLDDKLFDIIDRYSKNKEDMKLIMDLIKKKLSPVELEETLKKLKDNPLFKELFNEEEYNKFFKELKELLKDEINEFKCKDPNLYLKFMEEEKEEKYEYNHNKSTIGLMIKDKIVSKIKQNKKALKLILQNELKALAPKIKMFKNKKSNFKEVFETMNPEIKMELIKLIKIKREKIKNMKIGKIKNMNKFKSINKVKKAKFPKNPIIEEKIKSIKKMQKNLYKFEKINKLNKVKKNNKLNKIDKSYKINKNNNLQKNTYKNNNNVVETNKFLKQYSNILKKAKANDFVNYLISSLKVELDNLLKNSDFNLYIGSWFSNKSSLVDVRIIKNKDTDNQVVIGIQIQDNQYRLCVERRKGTLNFNNENALNELFNEFLNFGWFENYNKESKQIKNKITSMREMFCKYDTDIYKFIYQYYNLNENDLKFENLITQIRKDMLLAIDISNKIN
ncbi:MAG: hypothetical protein J6J33_05675, partial [Clostridia bacterium]|nr:hypothetical protein [Clostridia bacterium]